MSFPHWKLFVGCVIRTLGLNIRAIEKNSRSEREGIFEEEECIVQINGTELIDKSFAQWVSDSFIRHTFIVVMWITNRPPALFLSTSFSSFIIRLLCCSMRLFSVLVARSVQTQSSQTFCPRCYLSLYHFPHLLAEFQCCNFNTTKENGFLLPRVWNCPIKWHPCYRTAFKRASD